MSGENFAFSMAIAQKLSKQTVLPKKDFTSNAAVFNMHPSRRDGRVV
jgi:hypothetical protein